MNDIEYLVISSSIDYSTDLVCLELYERKKRYLRINRDQFEEYEIIFLLQDRKMTVKIDGELYNISNDNLKGIYFRAPVFLRSHKKYSIREQLYRSQWSSFIRNLIVFDKAKWINHPVNTYRAENKLFQLQCAQNVGLTTPKTVVGNALPQNIKATKKYIVKSLDTALFYDESQEYFTYTSVVSGSELIDSNIKEAPVILQEFLEDKRDIRVTVIGNLLFPVSITKKGENIYGDWRKNDKSSLQYNFEILPDDISNKIIDLMNKLGLLFGGVDLAFSNGKYYFIEVNPTGEWGWLSQYSTIPLEKSIVSELVGETYNEKNKKNLPFNSIIEQVFPTLSVRRANNQLAEKINCNDIQSNVPDTANIDEIKIDSFKQKYAETFDIKNKFEDKAKTNVIGITIAITVIMGSSGLTESLMNKYSSPILHWVSFIILLAAIIYLLFSGIDAIKVLFKENTMSIVDLSDLSTDNINTKRKYDDCIKRNINRNIIRDNIVFSSYICIRNALICRRYYLFLCLFRFLLRKVKIVMPQVYYMNHLSHIPQPFLFHIT